MLIYYDHYGRRDGFCFFGNNWPQGIRVDNADLQGTGYLWNIFTNLYGDLGANLNAPRSCFVLRDCFGPLHATVYGIAGVGQDGRRSVTYVDFAVRIPQNREETEAEFDPRDLLRELQVPHVPGTCVQAPVPPVWQPLPPDEAAMQLGRELAWRPLSVVWAGDTAARTVPEQRAARGPPPYLFFCKLLGQLEHAVPYRRCGPDWHRPDPGNAGHRGHDAEQRRRCGVSAAG